MIVFDTSIYIDALIPAIENRNVHAREIIKITTKSDSFCHHFPVYRFCDEYLTVHGSK